MNIIPISSESFPKHGKENKDVTISLPHNWWSADFSISPVRSRQKKPARLFPIQKFTPFGDLKATHKKWTSANGDYRVREPYRKDYVYYRDLKLKLIKYSVYPAVVIASAVIYFISFVLSNI